MIGRFEALSQLRSVPRPEQYVLVPDENPDGWYVYPWFDELDEAEMYANSRTEVTWIARVVKVEGGWSLIDHVGPYPDGSISRYHHPSSLVT